MIPNGSLEGLQDNFMVPKVEDALTVLKNLHYTVDHEKHPYGRIVQVSSGKTFSFIDQDHYELLGDAVTEYIQALLVEKWNFMEVWSCT